MKLKISVIGAGVAGLAIAIRMAVRGHTVHVYERSSAPGGKVGEYRWEGFRWDTGPGEFMLPDQFEQLFLLADEEMKVSLRYRQLDNLCRNFFSDGTIIDSLADADEFAREIQDKTGEAVKNVRRYLSNSQFMFDLVRDLILHEGIQAMSNYFSADFLRAIFRIWVLENFTTMHRSNKRQFKSERLVELFDRYAVWSGNSPYKASGILNYSAYVQHHLGVYVPEEGMHSLMEELYQLALRLGVEFSFDTKVERVVYSNKTINGIQTKKSQDKSDIVISDIDIDYFYPYLLPDYSVNRRYFKDERSASAMIFFWAMDREYAGLHSHNQFFSEDMKKEMAGIFKDSGMDYDPTISLRISSRISEKDAPEACENWAVMIGAPHHRAQDWDKRVDDMREKIVAKLESQLHSGIRKHIIHEKVITPETIEREGFSYLGSLYGYGARNRFSAFRRHPNYLDDVHGLYFVGSTVYPGGGLPMSLASAEIVERMVVRHYY